jgi:hypothetical protein
MQPEIEKRVEHLRNRIAAATKELDEATARFGSNSDEYLYSRIKQAYFWLDDLETIFIAMVQEERSPPKTLTEELWILQTAETDLANITMPLVKQISLWSTTYGEKFQSIG